MTQTACEICKALSIIASDRVIWRLSNIISDANNVSLKLYRILSIKDDSLEYDDTKEVDGAQLSD